MSNEVDILIVTALLEEREAARKVFSAGVDGMRVAIWSEAGDDIAPYLVGQLADESGSGLSVALGRPTHMGATSTGPFAAMLAERLKPRCLAMTGVCAGNPSDVALGDVIVAELTYAYDEGKRTQAGFEGDHRQAPAPDNWVRAAQELDSIGLPSQGEASAEDAQLWLLERLYHGADPRKHPARSRYFPEGTWKPALQGLELRGLVSREKNALTISAAGREEVDKALVYDVDPPRLLPFRIFTGPIASGNVVVKDGITWNSLKSMGMRNVIGLEMEGAAIGSVARSNGIQKWIVVKGVMDHADPYKDDRYKPFAARASAEVLVRLLRKMMPAAVNEPAIAGIAEDFGWRPRSLRDPIYDRIGKSIRSAAPGFGALFDRARSVAIDAFDRAAAARDLASYLRQAAAEKLAETRAQEIGKEPAVAALEVKHGSLEGPFIAKIWNSADEYVGQGSGKLEHGLGVYRIYQLSRRLSPNLQGQYAGLVEHGEFGPLGVYTFPNRTDLAGEWADSQAAFGYRDFMGSDRLVETDCYLGHFVNVGAGYHPSWVPDSDGIEIDFSSRTIICARYAGGKMLNVVAEIPFAPD